jgi:thiamine-phosphate pyrophosphorylase
MSLRPSLYLITPRIDDAQAFLPRLEEALATGLVEAVLLRLAPSDERALVNATKLLAAPAHSRGCALLLADPGGDADLANVVVRGGADGAHLGDPTAVAALRARLKDGRDLGAGGLRTKHDAMLAGEAGADYVLFGEPRADGSLPDLDLVVERAAWWAEIFQTPCAAYASRFEDIPDLAGTGAEFVALDDLIWAAPEGIAPALRRADSLLGIEAGAA